MRGIMIQGTSSDAGKTFIVTGLCRLLANMNMKICPFKSQNMSNNSYVTHDGLEISIAQALQAQAARLTPEVFMNPILLKPRRENSSEVILNGKVYASSTRNYREFTQTTGINAIRQALAHIDKNFDAVIIEGAGSPAEINLNAHEIVNMRIAREADVPVLLVADVDRGGSLASVVGTLELLGDDRKRVKGIIFNKFRGDISLFRDAVDWTEDYTGIKVVGVLPFTKGINLSGEDSLNLANSDSNNSGKITIGVPKFPGISNFSDIDPFNLEPDVQVRFFDENISVKNFHTLDAIILPGTKNTFAALSWLKSSGLDTMIKSFGGFIFGICGGMQVLGRELIDENLRENNTFTRTRGLELLPLITSFNDEEKITRQVEINEIRGYEIHFGRTEYFYDDSEPEEITQEIFTDKEEVTRKKFHELFTNEGIMRNDFKLAGTYLHGIFANDNLRAKWLNEIRRGKNYGERQTNTANFNPYDAIAEVLTRNLDVEFILKLLRHEDTMPQPE
ncbi:MAG: cobyric acid synthase [Synergistaceae bacterium]|nr:cobyric acid synthase [Synergistaceae bacterium]